MFIKTEKAWMLYSKKTRTNEEALVKLAYDVCKLLDPDFDPELVMSHRAYDDGNDGTGYWSEKSVAQFGGDEQGILYIEEKESFQDGVIPSPTNFTQELSLYGATNGCQFWLKVVSDFRGPKYAKVKLTGNEKALDKAIKLLDDKFKSKEKHKLKKA